jgi:hypothetical protein
MMQRALIAGIGTLLASALGLAQVTTADGAAYVQTSGQPVSQWSSPAADHLIMDGGRPTEAAPSPQIRKIVSGYAEHIPYRFLIE